MTLENNGLQPHLDIHTVTLTAILEEQTRVVSTASAADTNIKMGCTPKKARAVSEDCDDKADVAAELRFLPGLLGMTSA